MLFSGRQYAGGNLTDVPRHRAAELLRLIQLCDTLSPNVPRDPKTILANGLAQYCTRIAKRCCRGGSTHSAGAVSVDGCHGLATARSFGDGFPAHVWSTPNHGSASPASQKRKSCCRAKARISDGRLNYSTVSMARVVGQMFVTKGPGA